MHYLKRVFRLLVLVCLIMLALAGVGITGGIPVKPGRKEEDPEKSKIELVGSPADELP